MAIPDNELSLQPIITAFLGGRQTTTTEVRDYETGGIALSDPTQGHLVQVWETYVQDQIYIVIKSPTSPPATLYSSLSGLPITEVSLTFDQNMRPVFAFVEDGVAYFEWYDAALEDRTITQLASDVRTPKVSLDDKRVSQMANNDVILSYVRGDSVYYRLQRDRYEVEYLLIAGVAPGDKGLRRTGMSVGNRFQWEIFDYFTAEELIGATVASAADSYTNLPAYQVSGTTAVILTAADNAVWGVNPVITVYALQDPITGNYWVDTNGNLLVYTVTTTWD